jgi:hypothetical protein
MKHILEFIVKIFSQIDQWGKKGQTLAITFFCFALLMVTLGMFKYLAII